MSHLWAAEEELADSSGLAHGSISIGASETALNIFLLDKLKDFHMKYPVDKSKELPLHVL